MLFRHTQYRPRTKCTYSCFQLPIIPILTCLFSIKTPDGWTRCIHPQGSPYYHKVHNDRTYITDANAFDRDHINAVSWLLDSIEDLICEHGKDLPDNLQVYLEPWHHESTEWGYYFVDNSPDLRTIFWLHPLDLSPFGNAIGNIRAGDLSACSILQF